MLNHSIYGNFYINAPYKPKYDKNEELLVNIVLYITSDNNNPCNIVNTINGSIYSYTNIYFNLSKNGQSYKFNILKLMLLSVFPNIQSNETVDHIDNNYKNNNLLNLQWMSRSDNSRKGQEYAVQKTNQNGGRNGKFIIMKKKHSNFKDDYTKAITIGAFRSIGAASDFIKLHLKKDISEKSLESKITRALKIPHYSVYKFHFEKFDNDLDKEIWKPIPIDISGENKIYMASSHGRIKNSFGDYMQLQQHRYNKKYTHVFVNYKNYAVHRLVWMAFFGEIPDNKIILHNDLAPLNENGTYRNYLEYLWLGSCKENSVEYHMYKDFKTGEISNDFEPFIEKNPDINFLDISPEPKDELEALMQKPPHFIQFIRSNNPTRGTKFVIGRQCPQTNNKDISSTGSKKVSDRDKFIEIIKKYNEICGTNYLVEYLKSSMLQ